MSMSRYKVQRKHRRPEVSRLAVQEGGSRTLENAQMHSTLVQGNDILDLISVLSS